MTAAFPEGLPFTKMSGGGNDFIVLASSDAARIPDLPEFTRRACRRGMAVGADGVLVIEDRADGIGLTHLNADGGRSALCGNGTRCAARWARRRSGSEGSLRIHADAGELLARFTQDARVELLLGFAVRPPEARRLTTTSGDVEGHFLEVGIPHFLIQIPDVAEAPVASVGAELRRHRGFAPHGTNVSFLARRADGTLDLRTYERGVEAETLSCGTACVAAGVLAVHSGWSASPVICHTRSGVDLVVAVGAREEPGYRELSLVGDARFIYEGRLSAEAIGSLD